MTVRFYDSTHVGAPVLSGTAGALKALLKAVLVDGFNSTSVTITRVGDWAFVDHAAHGLPAFDNIAATPHTARKVLIAGADQAAYNGEHIAYTVDVDTYKFQVAGGPATPATGSITSKRPSFGWTNEFESGDRIVFRPPIGHMNYLWLNDEGTTIGRARGYEAMTAINTGTGPFPTEALLAGGDYWGKSSTADATARAWLIIGTERGFYMMVNTASASSWNTAVGYGFRDAKAYRVPDDIYATVILGYNANSATATRFGHVEIGGGQSVAGMYVPRVANQTGEAVSTGWFTLVPNTWQMGRSGNLVSTHIANGLTQIPLNRLYLKNGTTFEFRGEMPGVWDYSAGWGLDAGYAHGSTLAGRGVLAGRAFFFCHCGGLNSDGAGVIFETSDTWDE